MDEADARPVGAQADVVDAHHHVWDPRARPHRWLEAFPDINRPFDLCDLERVALPLGVSATVLVQVLGDLNETQEFLALAATSELVAGVVGWVDLTDRAVGDVLATLTQLPGGGKLVGVRLALDDADEVTRPEVIRGVRAALARLKAIDLLMRPRHLPAAVALVEQVGEGTLVIDHVAKPDIAGSGWEPWSSFMADMARHDSVVCKISGLVTEAGDHWNSAVIRPYVERVVELFGPRRLLFGSDWPVCTAVATYKDVLDLARELLAPLVGAEVGAVFSGNARRIYGLPDLELPREETGAAPSAR